MQVYSTDHSSLFPDFGNDPDPADTGLIYQIWSETSFAQNKHFLTEILGWPADDLGGCAVMKWRGLARHVQKQILAETRAILARDPHAKVAFRSPARSQREAVSAIRS